MSGEKRRKGGKVGAGAPTLKYHTTPLQKSRFFRVEDFRWIASVFEALGGHPPPIGVRSEPFVVSGSIAMSSMLAGS